MKAKEYAAMLNSDPTVETIDKVLKLFVHEAKDLIERRHCQTDAAGRAVLDELDQKWSALARLTGLSEDGFALYMTMLNEDLAMEWPKGREAMVRHPEYFGGKAAR